MALNVTRWAREQAAGGLAPKAALMALAERADPSGYCHPSLATLAGDMECGRATAKRAVHQLVDVGLVELIARYEDTADGGRRRTSNRYRVAVPQGQTDPGSERPGGQSDPTPGSERPGPQGQSDPAPRVRVTHQEPVTLNQSIEPVSEPSSSVGGDREREPASSSDDDDGISRELVDAVVELKMAGTQPDNPGPYRAAVARSVVPEHGDELRQVAAEHPDWRPTWIARAALGLPLADPSPAEVFRECPDCTDGLVDTGAGMDYCPTCRWARAS